MLKGLVVHAAVAFSVLLSGADSCQGQVRDTPEWRVSDKVKTRTITGTTYFVVVRDQFGNKKSVSVDHIDYVNCRRGAKFYDGIFGGHC